MIEAQLDKDVPRLAAFLLYALLLPGAGFARASIPSDSLLHDFCDYFNYLCRTSKPFFSANIIIGDLSVLHTLLSLLRWRYRNCFDAPVLPQVKDYS